MDDLRFLNLDRIRRRRWMNRIGWTVWCTVFLGFAALWSRSLAGQTENGILITLDGVRVEEMFGGMDLELFASTLDGKDPRETDIYRRFWADTAEERRMKLMPFFWGEWMTKHGSIAGDRARGSEARLANYRRFSYPGYAEILTGQARDRAITSNAKVQNPFPTVLEFLKDRMELNRRDVAMIGSWEVMRYIAEHKRGAIFTNSGFEAFQGSDPLTIALSRLQFDTTTPWDSVRHDVYTFRFSMAYLKAHRPRVFYLSLGETDDWAHDGRYDRVLQALHGTDEHFRQLWTFLQGEEQYRNKTSLLVTTDHGRGLTETDWLHHNAATPGSEFVWVAAVSPDSKRRGVWGASDTIYSNQIAATLSRFLGFDFLEMNAEAGRPIEGFFE